MKVAAGLVHATDDCLQLWRRTHAIHPVWVDPNLRHFCVTSTTSLTVLRLVYVVVVVSSSLWPSSCSIFSAHRTHTHTSGSAWRTVDWRCSSKEWNIVVDGSGRRRQRRRPAAEVPVDVLMAKLFDFQWQISVPDSLLQGGRFDRWEEVSHRVTLSFAKTKV